MSAFLITFISLFAALFIICLIIGIYFAWTFIQAERLKKKMLKTFKETTNAFDQIGVSCEQLSKSLEEFGKIANHTPFISK